MAVSMENIGVAAQELVRKETEAVRESQVLQQDENKIAVEKEKVVSQEEYRSVSEDGDTLKVSKDGEELEDARVIAKEDKAEQRIVRNNEEIRAEEVKKEADRKEAIAKDEEAKRQRAEYEQALKEAEQERKERQQEIREAAKEAEEKRSERVAETQNTNSNEKQQTTNNKENVQIEMVDKAMVDDINRRIKRANET